MMGTQTMRHGGKVGRENSQCKEPMASRAYVPWTAKRPVAESGASEGRRRGPEGRSQRWAESWLYLAPQGPGG